MKRALWAALVFTVHAGCAIPDDEPVLGFGDPCTLGASSCDLGFFCLPESAGATVGRCAPVLSAGDCPAPARPPGQAGTAKREDVVVESDAALAGLAGIHAVDSLKLRSNTGAVADIHALCPLAALQDVLTGPLVISESQLKDLSGLESLTQVAAGLVITENEDLDSLAGLAHLQQVGAAERARVNIHVVIARNEKLRQEDAETFATALGARANATLSVRICENKDGPSCPSELQDILEAF